MNELQRQMYLSVLGVDSYIPRWHLPYAPQSQLCELPQVLELSAVAAEMPLIQSPLPQNILPQLSLASDSASPVNNLIGDIFETKKIPKTLSSPITAADILAQLNSKPASVEPFSLSIWRPVKGVMVIDSRNTKLALPTELFISNILRSIFPKQSLTMREEVLRWPMIENSFAKRTRQDACNELQTWLSVQHEIRPLNYLLLMGENAADYFLSNDAQFNNCVFNVNKLPESAISALILPGLNEILQKPELKPKLFLAMRRYISSHESI